MHSLSLHNESWVRRIGAFGLVFSALVERTELGAAGLSNRNPSCWLFQVALPSRFASDHQALTRPQSSFTRSHRAGFPCHFGYIDSFKVLLLPGFFVYSEVVDAHNPLTRNDDQSEFFRHPALSPCGNLLTVSVQPVAAMISPPPMRPCVNCGLKKQIWFKA